MTLLTLFLLAVVIEHISYLWTSADSSILEGIRGVFRGIGLEKITWCKLCQTFWLSLIVILGFNQGLFHWKSYEISGLFDSFFTWIILHKTAFILSEIADRYLNRAPLVANVILHNSQPEVIESESES